MIKPIWRAPHNDYFTNWMDSRSRMSMPSMAGHALDTTNLAVEEYISHEGRRLLRTESDAIQEMKALGGHLFFASKGHEAFFGWHCAIVRLEFDGYHKKESFLTEVSYYGMVDGPLEKIHEVSKGWFGKKIRRKKVIPATKMYMLARANGNFGLINIGSEAEPFVPGNYDPKVQEAFDFCKKSLLANVPAGRLVLLDGPPGTGKTRFVRALMGSLHNEARVIVVPEHLTAMLADPDLIPVLKNCSDEGSGPLVLILEDADDCLKSREETDDRGSTKSLASLLNLSDGIVGALLDLRIIATTNIRITKMDKAITRPGRLLRRVEFGPLDATQVAEVFSRLTHGKGQAPLASMTLAEVYAAATEALTKRTAHHGADPNEWPENLRVREFPA